jgi:hypothetical protein
VAEDGISEDVTRFIREYISSIEQLEVLLLLHREPTREWTADELSRAIYISPEAAAHRLTDFCTRGFCIVDNENGPRYRYNPSISHLDMTIRDLRAAYEQRRVRVINMIFSNPIDQIKSFADAFKFRKDEE